MTPLILLLLIHPTSPAAEPLPGPFGWAGQQAAAEAWPEVRDTWPPFRVDPPVKGDAAGERAVLWDVARKANGGRHLPTFRQEIGSCVGHAYGHALQYLEAGAAARDPSTWVYRPIFVPFHYACGRMAPDCGAGRLSGADGSLGSWQAKAVATYGTLPADLPGLEPDGRAVIARWATRMPEERWLSIGRSHRVLGVAPVTTPDQVRDAVRHGCPVVVASDWGGMMRPPTVDGRLVNRRVANWPHCMAIIGYDGKTGKEPYWYVLNSWGPDAHGVPPDDAPPGGFWVRRDDVAHMVRARDSFALSEMVCFPARDWDFGAR